MHGSCVFVQESAKAVEPGWLDGGQAPAAAAYVHTFIRLSLTSSVWKSTWSTLKVDTYCLQLAIKALAYLESIHCRVYRLLFPHRVCRGAVAYSTDYGHPERVVFLKILDFWVWADKLGRKFGGHFGYFRPNYQHPFWYSESLVHVQPIFLQKLKLYEFGPQRIRDLAFVCP